MDSRDTRLSSEVIVPVQLLDVRDAFASIDSCALALLVLTLWVLDDF